MKYMLWLKSKFKKRNSVAVMESPSKEDNTSGSTSGHATSECAICLSEMIATIPCRTLLCGHKYHVTCIDNWHTRNPSCPLCRNYTKEHPEMVTFRQLAQGMVASNFIDAKEANTQLNALNMFLNGRMDYAQMRSICG